MSRIIGGTTAAPHDWPWQAQILIHVDKSWNHRCGGTLIDTEWVVTAAHCVFQNIEPSNYKIKLGAHDRESSEGALTIPVTAIHMHTRFMTDGSYGYDIAIMKLANPAPIGHTISPACLPGLYDQVTSGTMCYVTGWGMTEYGNAGARLLQQARIPVVSSEECERVNNKHRKVTMLCAGNGGNSSISGCHGDSGGPFVCMGGDGRWVLRGAVSWGDNECKGSTYSVFTRISSFVDWIKCKMTSEPLQRREYLIRDLR
ncbi:predicted protein [Nematostella vectensis]|uniref:Peptidase S1 domain-containing protein n=1 Tax=Nematostella vectensis TaxID=45351 RepID=A7S5B4_NEMVE|nr:predicted protein [Nematostella vectensis]|eukprot:XP_001633124.1 predicted protein [Nematostella vectensis]